MNASCCTLRLVSIPHALVMGLCLFLAHAAGASPTDWVWRHPTPLPYSLFSVDYADGLHGVAVGEHGAFLATADGGQSWAIRPTSVSADGFVEKIRFGDGGRGLAVGGFPPDTSQSFLGFALGTADGGATWDLRATVPNTLLYDVWLDGATGAVAVGFDANMGSPVVLRSDDDGWTWTAQVDASRFGLLTGVTRSPSGRWAIVGADFVAATSLLLTSDDGGATWDARDTGGVPSLNGVRFRDATHGVAFGPGGALLVTDDGGTTWAVEGTPTILTLMDGAWDAAGTLFLAGGDFADQGTVVSLPAGGTWSTSTFETSVHGLAFPAPGEVTVVGGAGDIFASHDDGATWTSQGAHSVSDQTLEDVSFADSRIGIAVGTHGTALRTTDGGANWSALDSGTGSLLYGVSMLSARKAIAVGTDPESLAPIIVGTDDGGLSWNERLDIDGESIGLKAVSCTRSGRCIAVGYCGLILRTDDAGGRWSVARALDCDRPVAMEAVAFADEDHAIAARQHEILHTSDGGVNWVAASVPTDQVLTAVSCVDSQHCFMVGGHEAGSGVVIATTDGGANWSLLHEDFPIDLQSVAFADLDHGFATDIDGRVYATADAGATWTVEARIAGNLYGVAARDTATVTVVGYANHHAAILQRDDRIFGDDFD